MKKTVKKRAFATKLSQDFYEKFSEYAAETNLKLNYLIEKAVTEYMIKNPPHSQVAASAVGE